MNNVMSLADRKEQLREINRLGTFYTENVAIVIPKEEKEKNGPLFDEAMELATFILTETDGCFIDIISDISEAREARILSDRTIRGGVQSAIFLDQFGRDEKQMILSSLDYIAASAIDLY